MNDKREMVQIIESILEKIVAHYAPEKVILFGSYAHGEADEDSDLDLLIVMDTELPPLEGYVRIRRVINHQDLPVDIFVITPEEFEETKDVIGGIAYAPAKYGRVLYEKS